MTKEERINQYIGWPFKDGGRDKDGVDCFGLVYRYLIDQGYKIKDSPSSDYLENFDSAVKMIESIKLKNPKEKLQENDIIYFVWKKEIHCGVYLGYDRYLQTSEGLTSRISHLDPRLKNRIKGIIRPSKTEEIELPPAGKKAVKFVTAAVGAIIGFVLGGPGGAVAGAIIGYSIGSAMTAVPPGSLEGGVPEAGAGSPKYKFGALRNTRSNEIPVPLIYGKCRVAGNIIYSSPLEGGTTVYQFIALSEGSINSISDVRFNNKPWSNFPGCSYTAYLGTSTQNVDERAAGNVKGLRRTAYLALTFQASETLPNLPTVTSVIEGIKVPIYISEEWIGETYSLNPAACIRDYLLRSKELGGAGLASGDVDDASFGSAYDYCAVTTVSDGAGGTETRYELNYVIDTKRSVLDNLQDMLATFGGFIIYKAGKIHLGIKKSLSVSHTFNMSNIKKGSFSYGYIPKENQINRIGVQYVDIDQADTKPIAWVDDYEDQVARGIIEKAYPMLGIGRFSQAARMAWQIMYDLKINPIHCAFQTGINALDVEAGDIIQLSHDVPAWTNKQFLVVAIQETAEDEVGISAIAYNSSVFNDGYGSGIIDYDYGSPPSQYDAPPDITSLSVEISKRTDLSFRWIRPSPALESIIRNYEIREGTTWDTAFVIAIVAANQFTYLMAITSIGTRTFHIKAVSQMGIYSTNSAQDSVAISKIPMGNVLLEFYLWAIPGVYGGTPSEDCHLEWTTNYNSAYYRRSIGLETATTMEEYETAEGTWDDFGDQFDSAVNPFIDTEQTFDSEELDVGAETVSAVSLTQRVTDDSGTGELAIWWRYGTETPLAGDYELFSAGSYTLRYMQFRIKLKANNTAYNIFLDDLVSTGDVFDVVDNGASVTIAIGGTTITFNEEFSVAPAITITSQDSPLIPKITEETKDSFKCTVYDKDGADVGGIVDWHSVGW